MRRYVLGDVQSEMCFKLYEVFVERYFIGTLLLVILHILYTQKWALPFPCSKTKSEISFSLGWAQEGLIVVPYVTTYAVALRMRLRIYVIGKCIGMGNIWR